VGIGGDGEACGFDHAGVHDVVEGRHRHGVRQAEGPPGFFHFIRSIVSLRGRRQGRVADGPRFPGFRPGFMLLRGASAGLHHGRRPKSAHLLRELEPFHGFLDLLGGQPRILHGLPVFLDLPEVALAEGNCIEPKGSEKFVPGRHFTGSRHRFFFFRSACAQAISRRKTVDMADPRPDLLRKAHPSAVR